MNALPTLICVGLNHNTAPIEIREQAAVSADKTPSFLESVSRHLQLSEAVLISTCNRVEVIAVTSHPHEAIQVWPRYLSLLHGRDFTPHVFHCTGADAVIHLFELAAGLRSMVIGETEIFGQIKQSYALATAAGFTQKITHRLFQSAFNAAKEARARTTITAGNVSIATVAADLAEKIFSSLFTCTILLLGAGEISHRTLRTLHSRGAQKILVANRTFDRAEAISCDIPQATPIAWEAWPTWLHRVDIVIASTSAHHHLIQAADFPHAPPHPLFLIDLAVPRNIDPAVNSIENIYLYNIDDLALIAQNNMLQRQAAIAKAKEILLPHAARFIQWLEKNYHPSPLHPTPAKDWQLSPQFKA
ncbi:MAG: glutamyl-tRNA reductase [Methylacidiphilales bacterium]|nr:glutamyl-tRNA reductase [Candidatus Methylacidiphilales bacterium]MDW8350195.1 glutamyl-tRNA reductase [Verrucomicrobiae bacterium]